MYTCFFLHHIALHCIGFGWLLWFSDSTTSSEWRHVMICIHRMCHRLCIVCQCDCHNSKTLPIFFLFISFVQYFLCFFFVVVWLCLDTVKIWWCSWCTRAWHETDCFAHLWFDANSGFHNSLSEIMRTVFIEHGVARIGPLFTPIHEVV